MLNGKPDGDSIGLGLQGSAQADSSIPIITPESAILRKLHESDAKLKEQIQAFDKELVEVIRKHKPANYCCFFSFTDATIPGLDGVPIPIRANGTTLVGDPMANVGATEYMASEAKKKAGIGPRQMIVPAMPGM